MKTYRDLFRIDGPQRLGEGRPDVEAEDEELGRAHGLGCGVGTERCRDGAVSGWSGVGMESVAVGGMGLL